MPEILGISHKDGLTVSCNDSDQPTAGAGRIGLPVQK